ncbi:hypothetical protein FisN_30Hu070 [Fistulifera solaris]|uniref:MYND-type domain-containing protein n=1 Tax=Fistulifera solaris TaxID=1519565 RepID=A0A1Z5K6L8_FISSO|nr:hypothetical protein FisN_30Hu070 [Fistulifera solaris]|eukprot:GAX21869.1 hypothetical protein FisN_30Hu070 [Fistulifera solaris]
MVDNDLNINRDRLPMYEGKDPFLREEPCCLHCFKTPDTKLVKCSRCQIAWYCNETCQKEHFPKHRDFCKHVSECHIKVQLMKEYLRSEPQESVFETDIGNFWGREDTIPFMQSTFMLASWYFVAAHESDIREVLEKALFVLLEHLRLGVLDEREARWRAPFFLLSLNRDDDAYSFIRYWVRFKELLDLDQDDFQIPDNYLNSKEGDWIYPRETDCRYLDVFQDIWSNENAQETELAFLVALLIIKLRIVAAHDAAKFSIELALGGVAGQRIQEVQPAIEEMVIRQDADVEGQREQVHRLMDVIHDKNPSVLLALLNPRPVMEESKPKSGVPSDVHRILMDCKAVYYRVPGAVELLKERLGSIQSSVIA